MTQPAARRAPRPRPQLDRDTILDAALRLAAQKDTEAVTVRMLGTELGADPTAIYRHFSDKDELVRAAIDRLLGLVNNAIPVDADWRQRLRAAAAGTLDVMLSHPAFGARVGTMTTGGVHELDSVEQTLDAFRSAGLHDADALRYYGMYSSYVLSFTGAQASDLLVADRTRSEAWVADYSGVDPRRYPAVAELREELSRLVDRDVYLTGVEIILESAASRAATTL